MTYAIRSIACALALATAACVSAPDTSSVTQPLIAPPANAPIEIGLDGDAVALAFSGGGARAAAFTHGVLLGLRDMKTARGDALVDRVALITAVSGGAITAAHFGLHGPEGLDAFRARALDKDWEAELHTSPFAPGNWVRLLDGGLNDRRELADWLDAEVFAGATMANMRPAPRIVLNATELFTGSPFAFTAPYFEAICADLGAMRVADAVGASMAVPLAFRPTVSAIHGADCPAPLPTWVSRAAGDRGAPAMLRDAARAIQRYRDPEQMAFVHLADGGIADNFGLSSLMTLRGAAETPYGPFSASDALRVRRLVFVVVNAEMAPAGDWPMQASGPDAIEAASAALDAAINANKRVAFDAFAAMLTGWEGVLRDWRCGLAPEEAEALGADAGWDCTDIAFSLDMISFADLPEPMATRLGAAPTRVSLPADIINDLIAGGREAALANPLLRSLTDGD